MPPSDVFPIPPASTPPVTPPPPVAPAVPPVFHNPLAERHDEQVAALPSLPQIAPAPPTPVAEPPVLPEPVPTPAPAPAPMAAPAPIAAPAVPPVLSVAELQDLDRPQVPSIQPAPVRLAPVPRGNDTHAQGLATSAHAEPFGATTQPAVAAPDPRVIEAAQLPIQPSASASAKGSNLLKIVGIVAVIMIVGLGGWATWALAQSKRASTQPTPTPSTLVRRDTAPKQIPAGYELTQTDCYAIQVPAQPDIQLNKDCRLALAYGAAKTSTLVISPYKDFDLVGSDTTTDQSQKNTFDSKKILEGLIASTTAGRTVADRQDVKVGNMDTVKITSSSASGGEVVAYAFIVLPEGNQAFAEKKFIAFIVTGAYGDDASRQVFDHVLQSWQWE